MRQLGEMEKSQQSVQDSLQQSIVELMASASDACFAHDRAVPSAPPSEKRMREACNGRDSSGGAMTRRSPTPHSPAAGVNLGGGRACDTGGGARDTGVGRAYRESDKVSSLSVGGHLQEFVQAAPQGAPHIQNAAQACAMQPLLCSLCCAAGAVLSVLRGLCCAVCAAQSVLCGLCCTVCAFAYLLINCDSENAMSG